MIFGALESGNTGVRGSAEALTVSENTTTSDAGEGFEEAAGLIVDGFTRFGVGDGEGATADLAGVGVGVGRADLVGKGVGDGNTDFAGVGDADVEGDGVGTVGLSATMGGILTATGSGETAIASDFTTGSGAASGDAATISERRSVCGAAAVEGDA